MSAATETTWTDVRAAMLRKGDVTPAGEITEIEFFGDLLRVAFDTEDGRSFTRTFDDLVSVQRPAETKTLECGCVVGKRRTERMCRHHQSEDDAIYAANERRRLYDPLPAVDNA